MMVVAMIVVDICHLTGLKQISDKPTSRDDNLRINEHASNSSAMTSLVHEHLLTHIHAY